MTIQGICHLLYFQCLIDKLKEYEVTTMKKNGYVLFAATVILVVAAIISCTL